MARDGEQNGDATYAVVNRSLGREPIEMRRTVLAAAVGAGHGSEDHCSARRATLPAGSGRFMLSRTRVAVIVAAVAVAAVHTSAQQPAKGARLLAVEDYLNFETVADPQISPDGAQIVYTRRLVNQVGDRIERRSGS